LIYCLYARKSSESDERQAMSIESQVNEMMKIAERDNLYIRDIYRESHSAKDSGKRPIFNKLLNDLRNGYFNSIITWNPDRLSRNAGDLGMLVDLMDQKILHQIKTYSNIFSNNPNEKFLLMILCSQAKLENDNKGINVKRGMRARCELGWRPCPPPIGYVHSLSKGEKKIRIDNKNATYVIEIFNKIAKQKWKVVDLKMWMDQQLIKTRKGKLFSKGMIYKILRDPFYYGEFMFDKIKYKGKHKPLISKQLYDATQARLKPFVSNKITQKEKPPFIGLLYCGSCGSKIVHNERFRERKDGTKRRHVYYYCSSYNNPHCKELYMKEIDLFDQLANLIARNKEYLKVNQYLESEIMEFEKERYEILNQQNVARIKLQFNYQVFEDVDDETIKSYIQYVLHHGNNYKKRQIIEAFKMKIIIADKVLKITNL